MKKENDNKYNASGSLVSPIEGNQSVILLLENYMYLYKINLIPMLWWKKAKDVQKTSCKVKGLYIYIHTHTHINWSFKISQSHANEESYLNLYIEDPHNALIQPEQPVNQLQHESQ